MAPYCKYHGGSPPDERPLWAKTLARLLSAKSGHPDGQAGADLLAACRANSCSASPNAAVMERCGVWSVSNSMTLAIEFSAIIRRCSAAGIARSFVQRTK